MKKCRDCKKYKELTEFHKNKRLSDGYYIRCRPCTAEFFKKYRKPEYFTKYYQDHKEKLQNYALNWYFNNKPRIVKKHEDKKEHALEYGDCVYNCGNKTRVGLARCDECHERLLGKQQETLGSVPSPRKCSECRLSGHRKERCPLLHPERK